MVYLYILQSLKDKKYYIGITNDVNERLIRHNSGKVKSTRSRVPFELIHSEKYETYSDARVREIEIKGYKGGIKFKKLIGV